MRARHSGPHLKAVGFADSLKPPVARRFSVSFSKVNVIVYVVLAEAVIANTA